MADKFPFFAAESGTWKTTSPNPHIDLSGTALALGTYPAQIFKDAADDTTLNFASTDTCTIVVWVDASNWKRYEGAVWTDATPDTLDLSTATLMGSAGTISNDDAVSVVASLPVITPDAIGAATAAQGSKADSAMQPGDVITSYTQQGKSNTDTTADHYAAGTLTIPLNGKAYAFTLTANTTLALTSLPTAPVCGDVAIIISQASSGGPYTLAYPAAWHWPDGSKKTMPTGAGTKLELVIRSQATGDIWASGTIGATSP